MRLVEAIDQEAVGDTGGRTAQDHQQAQRQQRDRQTGTARPPGMQATANVRDRARASSKSQAGKQSPRPTTHTINQQLATNTPEDSLLLPFIVHDLRKHQRQLGPVFVMLASLFPGFLPFPVCSLVPLCTQRATGSLFARRATGSLFAQRATGSFVPLCARRAPGSLFARRAPGSLFSVLLFPCAPSGPPVPLFFLFPCSLVPLLFHLVLGSWFSVLCSALPTPSRYGTIRSSFPRRLRLEIAHSKAID
jgi:hypothetical protein